MYIVQAEILYLQRYSTNFRNLSLSWQMLTMAFWVESFKCARVLLLQWQGENFAHRQHFKFCHFQPVHCASRNPISPKIFNRFSKSLPLKMLKVGIEAKDVEGRHLGGNFQVRSYFTFAMACRKLFASTTIEILPLSICTMCQQNPISPKIFSRISKSLPELEDVGGGH